MSETSAPDPFSPSHVLPEDHDRAVLIARVQRPETGGPSLAVLRDGVLVDITSKAAPTLRDLLEQDDPAGFARAADGEPLGDVCAIIANSDETRRDASKPYLLAPADLQAVKAAGVTFAESLLERVIEEQARGAPERAGEVRRELTALIGTDLANLKPGSAEAMALKETLVARGAWSQYLEVGIGKDAEIFTKGQPMSAVGPGARVGIHPDSVWNNPEPEVVLAVCSRGRILGAMLGNDVNLRDIEGRSALLLGRAKDNTASCSLGPFLRLFDDGFSLDDVRAMDVALTVRGDDGFVLEGSSSMRRISRDPADLAAATINDNHAYPDGFVLMLGTMFAPIEDRDAEGEGFTHHEGDVVTIATPKLGALVNRVARCHRCAPWSFGTAALMRNLAGRGLLA